MKNNLTMEINDFGPINRAKIDIGKINIIAGPNSSGKTTSSKFIYSLLGLTSTDGMRLLNNSIADRIKIIHSTLFSSTEDFNEKEKMYEFTTRLSETKNIMEIENEFKKVKDYFNKSSVKNNKDIKALIEEIDKNSLFTQNVADLLEDLLKTILSLEFNNIPLLFNSVETYVELKGNENCDFKLKLSRDTNEKLYVGFSKNLLDCIGKNEVIYLETPYILDFMPLISNEFFTNPHSCYHHESLIEKLKTPRKNKDVFDEKINIKIDHVVEKINRMIGGDFHLSNNGEYFLFNRKNDKNFTMKNTATGFKQLGIIQILLQNRSLSENSILIIDEPEVHLHPQLQLDFVRVLFLLVSDLNIRIYINTHSPQFVEAMELYSLKYAKDENCAFKFEDINFYLTEKVENSDKYDFNKISRENLDKIYDNLGKPYANLDLLRGELESKYG